ncbi:hypothetical protein FQR65_LT17801 [Abscondita terminalis]|nr:hypothetical protein FQR65_LT17801 [Abscondita terminalis]
MDEVGMITVELDGYLLTVDTETAEALKDPVVAQRYIQLIQKQVTPGAGSVANSSSNSPEVLLWKTKKPTQFDNEGTLKLLELRKQFDKEFNDKKTAKNIIWQKIAAGMNNLGFFVGEGVEGRERLRQKFANMSATYIKYLQKRKQTGEGKISYPPYFEEMDDILGDKHKINPVIVIDTARSFDETPAATDPCSSSTPCPTSAAATDSSCSSTPCPTPRSTSPSQPETSGYVSTPSTSSQTSRFDTIKKSVRPHKQSVIATLEKLHDQNLANRKQEFETMVQLMREQSQQRHEQILALIEAVNKKGEGKKRKRHNSDSD